LATGVVVETEAVEAVVPRASDDASATGVFVVLLSLPVVIDADAEDEATSAVEVADEPPPLEPLNSIVS